MEPAKLRDVSSSIEQYRRLGEGRVERLDAYLREIQAREDRPGEQPNRLLVTPSPSRARPAWCGSGAAGPRIDRAAMPITTTPTSPLPPRLRWRAPRTTPRSAWNVPSAPAGAGLRGVRGAGVQGRLVRRPEGAATGGHSLDFQVEVEHLATELPTATP